MVLEWREHEHGEVEEAVRADLMAQQALCACGLYKFWCLGGLRAKPKLLQMLVDYWDPDSESFQIYGMSLTVEVEDIYFIIVPTLPSALGPLAFRGKRYLSISKTTQYFPKAYVVVHTQSMGPPLP